MIRLLPIVDHLKAGGYRNVEGVLEFAGLKQAPRHLPALFVVPMSERPQPNRMSGITDQKVAHNIAIVLILPVSQRLTAELSDALAEHVKAIVGLMIGWKHPDAGGRWEYSGGDLMSADEQVVAWSIGFTASYHVRSR